MFGKKKQAPVPPSRKGAGLMQQMGYGGMAEMDDFDDDDEELNAELLALQGDEPPKQIPKKQAAQVNFDTLEKMVSEGMRDIPSDEELSDTEDSSLLAELEDLTSSTDVAPSSLQDFTPSASDQSTTALLEERIVMYMQAAENTGETSKKRRLERGIKTLQDLLKKANSGKPVNEEDIPPPVATSNKTSGSMGSLPSQEAPVPSKRMPPADTSVRQPLPSEQRTPFTSTFEPTTQPASHTGSSPVSVQSQPDNVTYDKETHRVLKERRDQYKQAALSAKRKSNMEDATKFVKVAKQFDGVISALEEGKPIDLSKMPPPPSEFIESPKEKKSTVAPAPTPVQRSSVQAAGNNQVPKEKEPEIPQGLSEKEEKDFFKAPEAPRSVMDALQQRLEKYKHSENTAKEAGESSKARRMGRIVKQYQDAIKCHKAGKPFDYEDLPTPPGYAPIPFGSQGSLSQSSPGAGGSASASGSVSSQSLSPSPMKAQRSPSPSGARQVVGERTPPVPTPRQTKTVSPQPATQHQKAASVKKSPSSRAEQQAVFLHERMEEYKMAALQAKKNRDLELAKKYMRLAKGFEPMIEAAENGLPVDLAQIPPSPNAKEAEAAFVVVSPDEVEISGDREEVFKKLEQDLIQQIRTSSTANKNFTKLGDVVAAMKFQQMEQSNRKDLESLKSAFRSGDPLPQFHYENRTYSIVQCNTELGDNDFELTIVRGIQYNPPSGYAEKDLDTYVKFEFPFPTDDPQTGATETIKASLNPEYGEPFKIEISRKSRGLVRVIERKGIKMEIFYKRGFLKSDKVLGIVNVKLKPIETKCTIHDSYDLTDGKKAVGGKLEVKMRIRNPLKEREIDEVKEKWLVIDKFIKVKNPTKSNPQGKLVKTTKSDGSVCMEVLKFERQQLDRQISCLKDSLSPSQTQSLKNKSKLLQEKIEHQLSLVKQGGIEAWKSYVSQIEAEIPDYELEARHLAQQGDMQKAQIILTKKKMAEKELAAIRTKIPNI